MAAAKIPTAGAGAWLGRVCECQQIFFIQARAECFEVGRDVTSWCSQHDLSSELTLEFFEICFGLSVEVNDVARQRTVQTWRPGFRISNQWNCGRFYHLGRESLQRPTATERPPRCQVRFRKSRG